MQQIPQGGLDICGAMSRLGLSQLALQSKSEASNTSEMCAVDRIYVKKFKNNQFIILGCSCQCFSLKEFMVVYIQNFSHD